MAPRHDFRDPSRAKFGKPGVSYPLGSLDHPTITEHRTGRKSSTNSATPFLTKHPNAESYPDAYLTQQSSDPGDDNDKFVEEIYETLPGPWITSQHPDEESGDVFVTKRRKNLVANVTASSDVSVASDPGSWLPTHSYVEGDMVRPISGNVTVKFVCIGDGTSGAVEPTWALTVADATPGDGSTGWLTVPNYELTVVSREEISEGVCYEVVTSIPFPSHNSKATAIHEIETISHQFFARPDMTLYAGGAFDAVAFSRPYAEMVRADTFLFWVLSDTKPAQYAEDVILAKFIGVQGGAYTIHENSLTDGQSTVVWNGLDPLVITLPASTPTLAVYLASWVGHDIIIHEEIKATKYAKLWRVFLTTVKMR